MNDCRLFFRRMLFAGLLAGPLGVPAVAAGQSADERVLVTPAVSNSAMLRDVALISAAGQAAHRATEIGLVALVPALKREGPKGIAARAAQLYLVSLPIAALTGVFAHEFGHVEYLRREGVGWTVRIDPWPWLIPVAGGVTIGTSLPPVGSPLLARTSGGSEAALVHESLVADRIYAAPQVHYFDWIQFIYAKLDTVANSMADLTPSNLADERAFFGTALGDPRRFAFEYETLRLGGPPSFEPVRDRAGSLRRRAATSLVDLTLVSAFVRTAQYLVTGHRTTEPLRVRVGNADVVPALHFAFTPAGYEHRASVRTITKHGQGLGYMRRITSPTGDHVTGAGGSWSWRPDRKLRATVRGDVWRTRVEGTGYRLEIAGERQFRFGRCQLTLGAALGYKTKGILEGHSPGSGPILGLSGGFRF